MIPLLPGRFGRTQEDPPRSGFHGRSGLGGEACLVRFSIWVFPLRDTQYELEVGRQFVIPTQQFEAEKGNARYDHHCQE